MTKNIDKTFMEAYQDLVDAANNITKQTTSIDESMKLFDQGMKDAELPILMKNRCGHVRL